MTLVGGGGRPAGGDGAPEAADGPGAARPARRAAARAAAARTTHGRAVQVDPIKPRIESAYSFSS